MSAKTDRPRKRRIEIFVGRYTANPLMRAMFKLGIAPPGMAIIETVGRLSGQLRQVPVVCPPAEGTMWLIAQHGAHAGWVRNLQANPSVRLKLGRRWVSGTAQLVPEDDVKARINTFSKTAIGRAINAASFRALESQPVSVRVDVI
jgi:deazaflavin-dependent oxidoreductase (nitroreductase family)